MKIRENEGKDCFKTAGGTLPPIPDLLCLVSPTKSRMIFLLGERRRRAGLVCCPGHEGHMLVRCHVKQGWLQKLTP